MKTFSNIFLIGPMGTGKTTIGRTLSRELELEFFDSDRVIEEMTGADIPLIFELEGEQGFRKREKTIINDLTQKQNIVLATGGGAILDETNRKHLQDRGTVIYLYSDLKQLIKRTSKDKNRPLLHSSNNPKQVLAELLEKRDPFYREAAHHVVDTCQHSIHGVIKAIIECLNMKTRE